jgi:hypothetical protein
MGQIWRDASHKKLTKSAPSRLGGETITPDGMEGIGIWRWDLATDDNTWNREMFVLLGLPPSMPSCDVACWIAAVAPADRERCLDASMNLRRTGKPFTLTFRVQTETGHRWLMSHGHAERDDLGEVFAYSGTMADVTPLYGMIEAALAEAEALADIIGANDTEPDLTQRLTKKILETLSASVKTFFTVAPVSRL